EVRNFLIANALFWLRECHVDGLRVDAVASMLYLDYGREPGQAAKNRYGGRENLEAVAFVRELNDVIHREQPGVITIAEESTSWPLVTKGTDQGGLGFDFKWNMGWMHDTLKYFERDPLARKYFHNNLTFGLTYAWSENFVLPFSHDEVVHMKGSMLNKMHGGREQKFANLRALYAYMWAHPGKKLLFMGGEIGQWREWSEERSLDWHLLEDAHHRGLNTLVGDLNRLSREQPALHQLDVEPRGFQWIDVNNHLENIFAFMRRSAEGETVVGVFNFAAAPRPGYRFGLPAAGTYRLILNTDSAYYAGSDALHIECVQADEQPWHGLPFSASVDLPPLAALLFEAPAPGAHADENPEACAAPTEDDPAPSKATKGRKRAAAKGSAKKTAAKKSVKKSAKKSPGEPSKRAPRRKAE
ncbi:MAG: 1,4-alpha-glucan branching enzyme, partial [Pyrinomonadaceae bacterium]